MLTYFRRTEFQLSSTPLYLLPGMRLQLYRWNDPSGGEPLQPTSEHNLNSDSPRPAKAYYEVLGVAICTYLLAHSKAIDTTASP